MEVKHNESLYTHRDSLDFNLNNMNYSQIMMDDKSEYSLSLIKEMKKINLKTNHSVPVRKNSSGGADDRSMKIFNTTPIETNNFLIRNDVNYTLNSNKNSFKKLKHMSIADEMDDKITHYENKKEKNNINDTHNKFPQSSKFLINGLKADKFSNLAGDEESLDKRIFLKDRSSSNTLKETSSPIRHITLSPEPKKTNKSADNEMTKLLSPFKKFTHSCTDLGDIDNRKSFEENKNKFSEISFKNDKFSNVASPLYTYTNESYVSKF